MALTLTRTLTLTRALTLTWALTPTYTPPSPLMRESKLAASPASRKTMCGARAPDSPRMSHRCRRWYGPIA